MVESTRLQEHVEKIDIMNALNGNKCNYKKIFEKFLDFIQKPNFGCFFPPILHVSDHRVEIIRPPKVNFKSS